MPAAVPPEPATAVVTGASGGIGAAAVRHFHGLGMHVALLDVQQGAGEAIARELGPRASFHACDVSDADAVEALAARIESQLPPVRALVTSAALIPDSETVLDMDLAAHDRMWRVNYFGTVHACRSFGRRMSAARRGSIVTVG